MHVKRFSLTGYYCQLCLPVFEGQYQSTNSIEPWLGGIFDKHIRKYEICSSRWVIFNGLDSKWKIFHVWMGEIFTRWVSK